MCEDIYKAESLADKRFWSGLEFGEFLGTKSLLLVARGVEMRRGVRKHFLFLGASYGTRDLILDSSRRYRLQTRGEMKGRHMGLTTVVLGSGDNGVRNYLFAPQAIDFSRLKYHVFVWSETTVKATCAR